MTMSELENLAISLGVSSEDCLDTLDADDPKASLIKKCKTMQDSMVQCALQYSHMASSTRSLNICVLSVAFSNHTISNRHRCISKHVISNHPRIGICYVKQNHTTQSLNQIKQATVSFQNTKVHTVKELWDGIGTCLTSTRRMFINIYWGVLLQWLLMCLVPCSCDACLEWLLDRSWDVGIVGLTIWNRRSVFVAVCNDYITCWNYRMMFASVLKPCCLLYWCLQPIRHMADFMFVFQEVGDTSLILCFAFAIVGDAVPFVAGPGGGHSRFELAARL